MNKLNEFVYYLYNHGWYAKRLDPRYSDSEDLITFENINLRKFEIDVLVDRKTRKINQVSITMSLNYNKLDDVYRRSDLENFLEDIKVLQKALDKIEFEIVRPMCEKFNLPFVNEDSYGGRNYYLDVKDIEEWLDND